MNIMDLQASANLLREMEAEVSEQRGRRDELIVRAKNENGLTLRAIGDHVGLSHNAIALILKQS
jgi:hypothetical protein